MTNPELYKHYFEMGCFALLAIGSLGLAVRVLLGPAVFARGWRGQVFKYTRGLGFLLFGLGCTARLGLLPIPYNIANLSVGLGAILFLLNVMMIYRAVSITPGHTPGTTF